MPRLGPAFLHQPIPSLSTLNMDRRWRWFVEGLAVAAPRAVTEFGWRPAMRLQRASGVDQSGDKSVIERSWLGAQRLAPSPANANASAKDLALAIELAPSAVFETCVNLPAAARRALAEAVALRLDVLSPLPADAVVHAIGAPGEIINERFDTGLAITRRSAIDALLGGPQGDKISLIGADAGESGRFRYVFFERKPNSGKRLFRPVIALAAATLMLVAGLEAQIASRIAEAERRQAELREVLISEKALAKFLDEAPASAVAGLSGAETSGDLNRFAEALPKSLWMEEITIAHDNITARGYSPVDAVWPSLSAPVFSPSDRPGVHRFSLSFAKEEQP